MNIPGGGGGGGICNMNIPVWLEVRIFLVFCLASEYSFGGL